MKKSEQTKVHIPIGDEPWLAPSGKILCDELLRIVSKDWPPRVWEQFLIATVEKTATVESLHDPDAYEQTVEELESTFWSEGDFDHGDRSLQALVRSKMRAHLTAQQRQILKHYFWDEMSEREVAARMGITQQQVTTSKRNSLKKLERLLKSDVVAHTYSERSREIFPPLEHPEMDLDICEVYREDLKGPMWCRGG